MANLNKTMIIGRLTADPIVTEFPSGKRIVKLKLATSRREKDQQGNYSDRTTFLEAKCLGSHADTAAKYLLKGREIYLDGRLDTETWIDKQTQQQRSKISIIVENLQFLGSAPQQQPAQQQPQQQPRYQQNTYSTESPDDIPW